MRWRARSLAEDKGFGEVQRGRAAPDGQGTSGY